MPIRYAPDFRSLEATGYAYPCRMTLTLECRALITELRVMNRLKALYRSWAIPCAGRAVYYTRHRSEWLGKIREAGVRRRAEQPYQQLDMLQHLRQQARRELRAESRKHAITAKLRQIPSLGPIRAALAVALVRLHAAHPCGCCLLLA
jgi:transposase